METLTGLRSWGGVSVKQGSSLKKWLGIRFLPREFCSCSKTANMTDFNYDLFKVSKMTNFNYNLFKVIKMTNFNYDLFKVGKMCVCFFMVKITINFKISVHREWLILLVS